VFFIFWIQAGGVVELGCFLFFGVVFAYPLYQFLHHSQSDSPSPSPYGSNSPSPYYSTSRSWFPSSMIPSFRWKRRQESNEQRESFLTCEAVLFVRKQLKEVLYYNLSLSLLASLTSVLNLWLWPSQDKHNQRWYIPLIDYVCAVMTTFAMLRRNREYIKKDLCFCCICHFECCDKECEDSQVITPNAVHHVQQQKSTDMMSSSDCPIVESTQFSDIDRVVDLNTCE